MRNGFSLQKKENVLNNKTSKQLRVFEEELRVVFAKASKENVSVQVALSMIIKEWEKYDTDHQSRKSQ